MSYLSKRLAAPVAAAALLMLSGAQVLATSLSAGGSIVGSPSAGVLPVGVPTAVNSGSYTLKDVANVTKGTGTYTISLYAPDTGTGNVTVAFNFTVATGVIEAVSLSDFSGSGAVDVTEAGAGATTTLIKRTSLANDGGAVISFDFPEITPTNSSKTFIIRTDVKNYTNGSMSFIDGGTANVVSFSPTSAPTPAAAFGGLGLLGLVAVSRKRQQA
jgi:hypothetical protein